jgi:hypothetical protein
MSGKAEARCHCVWSLNSCSVRQRASTAAFGLAQLISTVKPGRGRHDVALLACVYVHFMQLSLLLGRSMAVRTAVQDGRGETCRIVPSVVECVQAASNATTTSHFWRLAQMGHATHCPLGGEGGACIIMPALHAPVQGFRKQTNHSSCVSFPACTTMPT